ncbi:MAG: CBS domain-containing protein, partial [Acidobacteriota bacterium]
ISGEEGQVITVHQDAYIEQAAMIMMDSKASGMPVVDDDFRLVGMLSVIDILKAMVEMLGVNRKGTRINLRVDHKPEVIRDIAEILVQHNTSFENIVEMETKDGKDLLILRIGSLDYKPIIEEFKAKGFEVESIISKQ